MGWTDPKDFFHALRVQRVFGKRFILCEACDASFPRSIVPHLKRTHRQEWDAAVQDWLDLKNSGMTFRKIMSAYTQQKGQYILSWVVIKREVKAFAEKTGAALRARPLSEPLRWKPNADPRLDTTVWSFPSRGNWAVHSPDYEGNWSPHVPREIIRQYSRRGDTVLDPFVGGGTTLVECMLLGRRGSPQAIGHTKQRLTELKDFAIKTIDPPFNPSQVDEIDLRLGDARNLSFLPDDSIDLICTHPPYGLAIQFTTSGTQDLSRLRSTEDFLSAIKQSAHEFVRVLKPGGHCGILMGDRRRHGELIPLGFRVFDVFAEEPKLQAIDIIIKLQHHDSSTQFYRGKRTSLRYRIAHEYLFIFRKGRNRQDAR